MALDVICAKKYSLPLIIKNLRWHKTHNKDVGIVAFDLIGLLSTNHIFILQWHSRVNEEMFDVNIKIAQTTQHSWEFIVRNSSLLNFGDYPGDFILWSGDREIWSKSGISQITQESWQHCPYYQKHSPNSLHCKKWDKLTGKISAQLHRFIMHAAIKLFMSYCFTQIDIMQNKCMNADIQIPETWLQALLPFPAPLPECPRELARRLAQFRPCMV